MIEQDSNEKTSIPTLADIVVRPDEEELPSLNAHKQTESASTKSDTRTREDSDFAEHLFTTEFKRILTRLVYKKLHERLASASHEIVVEIMEELENALNNPDSASSIDINDHY